MHLLKKLPVVTQWLSRLTRNRWMPVSCEFEPIKG